MAAAGGDRRQPPYRRRRPVHLAAGRHRPLRPAALPRPAGDGEHYYYRAGVRIVLGSVLLALGRNIARGTEHLLVEAEALTALAGAELRHGEAATAATLAREALATHRSTGRRKAQAEALDILRRAVAVTGEEDPAPYRQEADEIFWALGIPVQRH
ncbi:hypothetical protein [Streptomyces neyagawaensis]|uniref:Uncharacterized protein n=1 Tax=Streptomyces neyagawaensis TaxID=42238 RepID=A0ABV3BAT6_9ACTN